MKQICISAAPAHPAPGMHSFGMQRATEAFLAYGRLLSFAVGVGFQTEAFKFSGDCGTSLIPYVSRPLNADDGPTAFC